jgi:ribosomal protein S18 acetylase RimI-like enzyme
MNISEIEKEDLADLAILYQQLIPNEYSIPIMETVFSRNIDNPNHLIIGAKVNGDLVGTLLASTSEMLFGKCKSFMVIEDVVVDSTNRKKGIGNALMSYAEKYAKKQDCSYIMLITDRDRKGSQDFYKSPGYKTDTYCAFKKHI